MSRITLIAEIVRRIPEMARDSAINNEQLLTNMFAEELNLTDKEMINLFNKCPSIPLNQIDTRPMREIDKKFFDEMCKNFDTISGSVIPSLIEELNPSVSE